MAKGHSKDTELFVHDADLTTYCTSVELNVGGNNPEVTAFGDDGRKWSNGLAENRISLELLYDDTDPGGSEEALSSLIGAEQVLSVFPVGAAVGAVGYGHGGVIGMRQAFQTRIGDIVKITTEADLNDEADRLKSLGPKTTSPATANGTSIDDAASSSDGGSWIYHIIAFSATGGNARWQVVLQDSANDSSFATVGSETVNITAVGAARSAFTGTLRRYVRRRIVLDATSGSLTYHVSYERD